MDVLNLPNRITLARLLASVGLFAILAVWTESRALRTDAWALFAFLLFVGTAATDWLDGYLARRLNLETALGRILDPFVDKVVVCGTLVFLAHLDAAARELDTWMVVVVLSREFFVNAIRGFMESRGLAFGAAMVGKVKMILQCVVIGALLFQIVLYGWTAAAVPAWFNLAIRALVWAMIGSTLYSGYVYAHRATRLLREGAP